FPVSLLPRTLGFAGGTYGATATRCGTMFVALALGLTRSIEDDRRPAPSPVRAFHPVPVCAVRGALGRPQRGAAAAHPFRARRSGRWRARKCFLCAMRGSTSAKPEGLTCGTVR